MPDAEVASLASQYQQIRQQSNKLCEGLEIEDFVAQSMPDASPIKWHIAHTTWFFETFILKQYLPNYQPFNHHFEYLFNSYYNAVGQQFTRAQRGLLTRPTVQEVMKYRHAVDQQICQLLERNSNDDLLKLVVLGLHHEQQHQELMLTDLKHLLAVNPMQPAYQTRTALEQSKEIPLAFTAFEQQVIKIGYPAGDGFCFDNEQPRHEVLRPAFELSNRPVSNAEMIQFITEGGYRRSELWLSEGWAFVQENHLEAPLYWQQVDGKWCEFTLSGLQAVNLAAPVTHISLYEADALARWLDARLPTEFEWESAAAKQRIQGNFFESGCLHPSATTGLESLFGNVWQWTSSSYAAYPGYQVAAGAVGEYNGKFMCNQYVLRGGSCVTSQSHMRLSYRNFFPANARWQFTGVRLARSV